VVAERNPNKPLKLFLREFFSFDTEVFEKKASFFVYRIAKLRYNKENERAQE